MVLLLLNVGGGHFILVRIVPEIVIFSVASVLLPDMVKFLEWWPLNTGFNKALSLK